MTNVHHEVVRLVADAATHLDDAERLLGGVDLAGTGASMGPVRERIRGLRAEVSMLGALS
jgi:hypothetical protein